MIFKKHSVVRQNLGNIYVLISLFIPILNLWVFYEASSEWISSFLISLFIIQILRSFTFPIWNEIQKLIDSFKNFTPVCNLCLFSSIATALDFFPGSLVLEIAPLVLVAFFLKLRGKIREAELIMQAIPVLVYLAVTELNYSLGVTNLEIFLMALLFSFLLLIKFYGYAKRNAAYLLRSLNTVISGMMDEVFVVSISAGNIFIYKLLKSVFSLISRFQYMMNMENYYYWAASKSSLSSASQNRRLLKYWSNSWLLVAVILWVYHALIIMGIYSIEETSFLMFQIATGGAMLSSTKLIGGWSGALFYLKASRSQILNYNSVLACSLGFVFLASVKNDQLFFILAGILNMVFNLYLYRFSREWSYDP
jgi:hypothetical protein